jgi:hypothetical protein
VNVVGIDYNTNSIDMVIVGLDGGAWWKHYDLPSTGDAFARMCEVANVLPARRAVWWDGIAAVGIEEPMSRGPRSISLIPKLKAMQGAIVSCLPPQMRIVALTPTAWRNAVGLPGNASKDEVRLHVHDDPNSDPHWPQDACDAFCMAKAVLP